MHHVIMDVQVRNEEPTLITPIEQELTINTSFLRSFRGSIEERLTQLPLRKERGREIVGEMQRGIDAMVLFTLDNASCAVSWSGGDGPADAIVTG